MGKAVETVHRHESTEICYPFNFSFNGIADIDRGKESLFLCGLCSLACVLLFLKYNSLRSDYLLPSAILLDLQSAEPQGFTLVFGEILYIAGTNLFCGNKHLICAHISNKATLVIPCAGNGELLSCGNLCTERFLFLKKLYHLLRELQRGTKFNDEQIDLFADFTCIIGSAIHITVELLLGKQYLRLGERKQDFYAIIRSFRYGGLNYLPLFELRLAVDLGNYSIHRI